MPLTRIVNAAIDASPTRWRRCVPSIVAYAGSDLICYRAEGPQALVEAQDRRWAPAGAWAREALGARLMLAEGVMHVAQDPEALDAVEPAVEPYDALALAALHTVTTLTGSAVIALALARGRSDRRRGLGRRPCRRGLADEPMGRR